MYNQTIGVDFFLKRMTFAGKLYVAEYNACFSLYSAVKGKKKWSIAVSDNHLTAMGNHMPYEITQCYLPPGSGDFLALTQLKLVLDLTTLEECNAELT